MYDDLAQYVLGAGVGPVGWCGRGARSEPGEEAMNPCAALSMLTSQRHPADSNQDMSGESGCFRAHGVKPELWSSGTAALPPFWQPLEHVENERLKTKPLGEQRPE